MVNKLILSLVILGVLTFPGHVVASDIGFSKEGYSFDWATYSTLSKPSVRFQVVMFNCTEDGKPGVSLSIRKKDLFHPLKLYVRKNSNTIDVNPDPEVEEVVAIYTNLRGDTIRKKLNVQRLSENKKLKVVGIPRRMLLEDFENIFFQSFR